MEHEKDENTQFLFLEDEEENEKDYEENYRHNLLRFERDIEESYEFLNHEE